MDAGARQLKRVVIYTDGACSPNPGPGGWGAVLLYGAHRREISGGFRWTTNNRMELWGAIAGLERLKQRCSVRVCSDSRYVVHSIEKGWALRWRQNGWRNGPARAPVPNADLWQRLLELCTLHEVKFEWVRGHSGDPGNERADRLAVAASRQPELPADEPYERAAPAGSGILK
jgi:ribonuclease HI